MKSSSLYILFFLAYVSNIFSLEVPCESYSNFKPVTQPTPFLRGSITTPVDGVQSLKTVDRRTNKNALRLMQYNVEWLFIDYYAASNCPGSGCSWANQTAAETHVKYVSTVISKLNPDIINVCEVEGINELNAVISSTTDASYKSYLIKGTDTSTGQNVGTVTRIDPAVSLYRTDERIAYPVPGSKCGYTGSSSTSGVSKHYITEYSINGMNIAMIGAHLLAFPTDVERCAEREAQAQVLQNVISTYIGKKYEVIMLGDFNDFDGEVLDANNNKPTSLVLDILKGRDFTESTSKYTLYSAASKIAQTSRFSDWYDKNNNCLSTPTEFSMIDHVLVTENLMNKIDNVFIYQEYSEFCGTYNSDHYPVIVDFVF